MAATQQGAGRLERLQEIEQSRMNALKQELSEGGQDASVLDVPPEPQEAAEQPTAEQPPEEQPQAETPPEEPKVKIKVDGEEKEVTQKEVLEFGVRAMQKEIAADKRLEEATRIKKQMEEAWAAAQRQAQVPTAPQVPSQDAPVQPDDPFIQAVKKIQYGSEAEAAEAMKTIVAQAAQAGRPEGLTMQRVQDFMDFREASKWAFDEYKDLLGDPVLRVAFAENERQMRAKGDARPYREIYTEIGNGLREWLKGKAPAPSPQSKVEKKAAVVPIPSAAARPQAPQQQKEPSVADTIAEMRKARKQG